MTEVGQILVVTDHDAIYQTVKDFGGEASLVTEPCRTGTDRVAKVASQLTYDTVVNLQADEILLHPELLSDLIQTHNQDNNLDKRQVRPYLDYCLDCVFE